VKTPVDPRKRRMWRAILLAAPFVFLSCKKSEPAKSAAPEVAVARVEQKDVPISKEWVGTLDGMVNAQIKSQVTGYLLRKNYTEGAVVRKGQLLFEIDPRTFQAALDQAKAQLANANGQLAQTEANQMKTQLDVNRYTPLAKEQAVSQQDLDNAVQANRAAQAQVRAAKAQIDAAQAQVEAAQLNLSFTRIISPIDGLAGVAVAQIGDLVGPTSLLATVSTVDPIKAYFAVSEREYLDFVNRHPDPVERAAARAKLDIQMILANGETYAHKGYSFFVDRQVNVGTGSLRAEGLFPNPGNILRPGQFARIRIVTRIREKALLVPQRAVTELQGSYQVAVVGGDNKVEIRPVTVAERVGTEWIIDQGLKPSERVIAEGTQRARQGMTVTPTAFTAQPETKSASASEAQRK